MLGWFRRPRRLFCWKRFFIVFLCVESCIAVAHYNSAHAQAALATKAFPSLMNNAVTRVIKGRLLRAGIAANDNAVAATLGGIGSAGAEVASGIAVAAVAGTSIAWAPLLIGAGIIGAATYLAISASGSPSHPVTSSGGGNVVTDAPTELFPKLWLAGPGQSPSTVTQWYISGYNYLPVDVPPNQQSLGTFPTYTISGSPYGALVGWLHFMNLRRRQIGVMPDLEFVSGGSVSGSSAGFVVRTPAFINPKTGVPTAEQQYSISAAAGFSWYDSAHGAQEIPACTQEKSCLIAATYSNFGCNTCNFFTVDPSLGYAPIHTNQWLFTNYLQRTATNDELAPALVADLANKLWAMAAARQDYHGVPYPNTDPVTVADAQAVHDAAPQAWPRVQDLTAPVAPNAQAPGPIYNIPFPANDPAWNPNTNPNYEPAPGTSPQTSTGNTTVDLGPDPGIQSPTLEQAPSWAQIANPFFTWFPHLASLSFPAGTCPTSTVTVFDHQLTLDQHCQLIEDWRAAIGAVMLAVWTMAACVVLLRA